MRKLLAAEFTRIFHSLIFIIALGSTVIVGELGALMCDDTSEIGMNFLFGFPYLVWIFPILIALFLGIEYSDGTIRNKLIIGHRRSSIYLSKLIVCSAVNIMLYFFNIVCVFALAKLQGKHIAFVGKTGKIGIYFAAGIGIVLAFTAILVAVSMSIQSRAAGVVLCMAMVIWWLMWSSTILYDLDEPEYDYYPAYQSSVPSENDMGYEKTFTVREQKNPYYVDGRKREVYEFLSNVLPYAQVMQISYEEGNVAAMCINNIILILASTGIGMVIFQKKDFK